MDALPLGQAPALRDSVSHQTFYARRRYMGPSRQRYRSTCNFTRLVIPCRTRRMLQRYFWQHQQARSMALRGHVSSTSTPSRSGVSTEASIRCHTYLPHRLGDVQQQVVDQDSQGACYWLWVVASQFCSIEITINGEACVNLAPPVSFLLLDLSRLLNLRQSVPTIYITIGW